MSRVRISDAVRTIKSVVPEAKTSEIERALRLSSRGGTVAQDAVDDIRMMFEDAKAEIEAEKDADTKLMLMSV